MPASCRSATPPSSASAPMPRAFSPSTSSADPLVGPRARRSRPPRSLGFVTSFLVLRGADLTRLMVTLGVALVLGEIANQPSWLTGGADGLQGVVDGAASRAASSSTSSAAPPTPTASRCCSCCSLLARRIVHSPFGLSLQAIRDNPLRAAALGMPVNRAWSRSTPSPPPMPGVAGALLAQTTRFVSLDVLRLPPLRRRAAGAGHRRRRLSLWRPRRRGRLQGAAGRALDADAAVLAVLARPVPGRARAGRPRAPDRAASYGAAGAMGAGRR